MMMMNDSILSSESPSTLKIEEDDDSYDDEEEIYPEDEIDQSIHSNEEENEDEIDQRTRTPPPPPPPSIDRGGRRKGVPRRLQISDERLHSSTIPKQFYPPAPPPPPSTSVHPSLVTLDHDPCPSSSYSTKFYPSNFDENNNEEENTLEIVDDLLADLVTQIVREIREERQQKFQQKTKIEEKFSLPKSTLSIQPLNKSEMLFNETNKTKTIKASRSPPTATTNSSIKRPKMTESSPSASVSLQHQQLLWQMTQQLLMPNPSADFDSSSLLKQQLLGMTPPVKRPPGRPPKQSIPPQAMRSSTNMTPPSNFAPRRRGRPPKYVTERTPTPSQDFDPSSYDQLFAAIENSVNGTNGRTAFQSALASMLGQPNGARNGTPASLMKQSAGQTRQSQSNAQDFSLAMPKKRGPGRPPKNQTLINSHLNHGNFPPTMVPSSPSSFDFNAALIEMFQQQQQHAR